MEWATRRAIAEELYDYAAAESAAPKWTGFLERSDVIDDPTFAPVLVQLRDKMDVLLRERSVVAPARVAGEGEARVKRKKQRRD